MIKRNTDGMERNIRLPPPVQVSHEMKIALLYCSKVHLLLFTTSRILSHPIKEWYQTIHYLNKFAIMNDSMLSTFPIVQRWKASPRCS